MQTSKQDVFQQNYNVKQILGNLICGQFSIPSTVVRRPLESIAEYKKSNMKDMKLAIVVKNGPYQRSHPSEGHYKVNWDCSDGHV